MKDFTVRILFIFFVAVIIPVIDCQKWNNGKGVITKKNWKSGFSEDPNGRPLQPEISSQSKNVKSGIGAWGYVSIALFLILSGLGIYYTIIFYPILCKKQRMYHVMGSTTVSVACLVPVGEEGREGGRPRSGTNEGNSSYAINNSSQTTF